MCDLPDSIIHVEIRDSCTVGICDSADLYCVTHDLKHNQSVGNEGQKWVRDKHF